MRGVPGAFVVRAVSPEVLDYKSYQERQALTWWATGRTLLPRPIAVTGSDLVRLLRRLLPRPLRDAIRAELGYAACDINLTTVIQPVPSGGPIPLAVHRHALPVTVVSLAARPDTNVAEYSDYLRWLGQAAQRYCPVGITLEVRMSVDGERNSR